MTLNLTESNKNSNYYLSQIDDIGELSKATKIQVDDIQTDVNTVKTDLSTVQGQISALITAGSAGESQIEVDVVILDTATNTGDISDMKIDITDLQAKTAFIESVTASSTTQTEKTTYLNDQGGEIGYIGPQGDELYIGCSASKNLVIDPDQGSVTHYCENTYFGDNYGPGRLILNNNGVDRGSITIDGEVQNHAYTDLDHTRLNAVDSDIANLQNQLNTTNTDVSSNSTDNAATQIQLDIVADDLNTAESFILGHTDDINDLTVLINTNANNITNINSDIADLVIDVAAVNTRVDNIGTEASNQTQVDSIQLSVNAHTDDISDIRLDINGNDTDIADIYTQIGTINTNLTNVENSTAAQTQVDAIQVTVDGHTTDISNNATIISSNASKCQNLKGFSNGNTDISNFLNFKSLTGVHSTSMRGDINGDLVISGSNNNMIYLNTTLDLRNTNVKYDDDSFQTTAYTDADKASLISYDGRINDNDTDIADIYTQIGTINTNVDVVSAANVTTQTQLDTVQSDLNAIVNYDTDIVTIQTQLDENTNALVTADTVFGDIETSITDLETSAGANEIEVNKLKDINQINYITTVVPDPVITTYSDHFNYDVLCYYDFSDPNKLGRDKSGKHLHALNTHGVEHSTENTHSAYFKRIEHTTTSGQHRNQHFLDCTPALGYLKQDDYTISVNVKPLETEAAIFSFTKNDVPNSYFYAYLGGDSTIQVIYRLGGSIKIKVVYPFPLDGNWHNIIFTNRTSAGNALYIDNVLVDNSYYTDGGTNISCDLNISNLGEPDDRFTLGAISISMSNRGDVYRFPYEGYMSDFIMYNRRITDHERAMLSSGVIGYDVILLVGQSNMTGEDHIVEGIDDDYSLHQNRVYQYETKANIDISTSPYNYNGTTNVMSIATGPLDHPQAATLVTTKMGPWKTFIDDYIRYSDIPFRKNILLVPLAAGGSSFQNKWMPGLVNHEIALKAMDQVMNEGLNPSKSYKVTAMLFNMGEADISLMNRSFKSNFLTTYNSFVSNLNGFDNTIPVVLTQISGEYETIRYIDEGLNINVNMQESINTALVELADENDKFQLALSDGLVYKTDKIHLDITGYRALGQRMFDKYMSILGKANKKPAYGVDNNIKDVVMQSDLLLKPKNELNQWNNLSLDCFASKEIVFTCTNAMEDTIELKYVKLGPLIFVSLEAGFTFTADNTGSIDCAAGSIDLDLRPSFEVVYATVTHRIFFKTNGSFSIVKSDGLTYTSGSINNVVSAFNYVYTQV